MVLGKVYLVGAGPGDPKLLTLRAAELLETAQVLVYDRLVGEEILKMVPKSCEKMYVGKKSGKHIVPQDKITELLVTKAKAGINVVRLKGGDPFVFGRGAEEAEVLAENGIKFEVVPGISSSVAAPMYSGIPLTHRDFASSVAIVTGHQAGKGNREIKWSKIADSVDTIVILMGVESLASITKQMLDDGVNSDVPVALIQNGTLKEQRTIVGKIGTIADEAKKKGVRPPAIAIIGEVVRLGSKLSWFKESQV